LDSHGVRDAVLVAGLKTTISLGVLATGFRALSDDDFARIVIAERFAHAPSFDPSGTSWLPFPFWVTGGVMAVTERSVMVARVTAFVLGIAAALLLWIAARWLGLGRRAAIAGAALASLFPYAAWLGVATIPEALTGALVVLGIAALSRNETGPRYAGALALSAACLSRYEPWPVAAVFGLYCCFDAIRERRPAYIAAGGLSIAGAMAWLVHGAIRHHDAFFFVKRVAAYRRAVGGGEGSILDASFRYPSMLFRCEPELAALALSGVAALVLVGSAHELRRYRRGAVACLALLSFLVVGELRDGAPTHHAERALFAIWSLAGVLVADVFWKLGQKREHWIRLGLITAALVGLAAFVVRPWYARRDAFIDRTSEIEIGRAAKRLAKPEERLLIEHVDFGFYAVIAGFGAPERATPIDDHDPRGQRVDTSSPAVIREMAARERATLVVLTAEHRALLRGETLAEVERFVLLRLGD
jgi:hypothetical protein